MALLKRKTTTTLADTLAAKATTLRHTEALKADTADAYITAAETAKQQQLTASKHASAVERAQTILVEAGVTV